MTFAVAGRREAAVAAKAKALEAEFPRAGSIGTIVADAKDAASLEAMCKRAHVVLACAGPFRFLGEPLVEACAKTGCSYADVTGEPEFSERIAHKHAEAARRTGATLVTCAGFDSIPADMGLLHAKRAFLDRFGPGSLPTEVTSSLVLSAGPEGMAGNTATYESAVHGFGSVSQLKSLRKAASGGLPAWALPGAVRPGPRMPVSSSLGREPAELGGKLTLPFPGSDASVVRRSQTDRWCAAARAAGLGDGPADAAAVARALRSVPRDTVPVQHGCYVSLGSYWYAALTIIAGTVLATLAAWSWGRALLLAYPSLFSFGMFRKGGPTEEQKRGTSFAIHFVTRGFASEAAAGEALDAAAAALVAKAEGRKAARTRLPPCDSTVVTTVRGPEPGYIATPIMVVETGLCLLRARRSGDKKKAGAVPAGVFTPAAALADTDILDRLAARGIIFEVRADA